MKGVYPARAAILCPEAVTTAAIDGSAYNILYTKAFQAANSSILTSGGLPDNGILFTAAGDSWQLHSYSSNNALFFPAQSAVSNGSLSLHTPTAYWRLSLLAAAGYGPTTVTVTLKFTDSSSTNYGNFDIMSRL